MHVCAHYPNSWSRAQELVHAAERLRAAWWQEGEELPSPWGSRLGPAACTEVLFGVYASAEGQRLVADLLKYSWVLQLEEFIYYREDFYCIYS